MKIKKSVNPLILLFIMASSLSAQQATVYTTAKNTALRISKTEELRFTKAVQPLETNVCVFVDTTKKFQRFIGIGSALTDASAETFYKLPEKLQNELLTAFYDKKEGIGYTLARTSINSCDFSSDTYNYVADNDVSLKSFNISHDMKYRVPFIQRAIAAAGGNLPLIVSPWSPPAWMKSNNDMLHGGSLLPQYYQTWADYFVKFLKAYQNVGIPVFGMTVQNEPMAKQTWESCIYTAEQERDFLKNYLGPTIEHSPFKDKKIIIWDHNRDLIYQRAEVVLEDTLASKYAWGMGFHWYETWTKSNMMFDNVRRVKEAFPDKHLIFTEGCVEKFTPSRLTDWALGERYGNSLINDFNNGTEGWLDWNILLDEKGGPNHVGNYCFAPVIADTKHKTVIYTNIYYYIGQFSKFIRPGAQRVISSTNREQLQATSFVNPNGETVVVVMNNADLSMNYQLFINNMETSMESLPHSISTIIIK